MPPAEVRKDKVTPTIAVVLLALLCLAHFVFSVYWIRFKLGTFYYQRNDDVYRIALALFWSRHIYFQPNNGSYWLPFPMYLLGACLRFFPDPHGVPLYLGSLLSAASLVLVGLITLELIPERPAACLLAPALVAAMGWFERIGLSAGAEPYLWLFLLLGVYSWILYRRRGGGIYLAVGAMAFLATSGTRYEGWLYIGALLPFAAWFFHEKREKYLRRFIFLGIAVAYILIFIAYSETHMPRLAYGLSWQGIRLYFRGPEPGIIRSFGFPPRLWFDSSPWLALAECAGMISVFFKRPAWRWYLAWVALCFLSLTAISGIFGFSMDWPERILVLLHLLLIPLACDFFSRLAPKKSYFSPALAAAAILIFSWKYEMPELADSAIIQSPFQQETFIAVKAIHETDQEFKESTCVLFELRGPGWREGVYSFTPVQFAFQEHPIFDRKPDISFGGDGSLQTKGNPSVLEEPKARLAHYLADKNIGWIIAHSARASSVLRGLAIPVATVGSTVIFERGLSKLALDRCRGNIRHVKQSLPGIPEWLARLEDSRGNIRHIKQSLPVLNQ